MLMCNIFIANAQIATENSKLTDNWYVGIEGGVFTPLNFNSVFPLNSAAGLKIGRDITPVLGLQIEGLALFNNNGLNSVPTTIKATNVGLNGTLNLTNLFKGYRVKPRTLELQLNNGLGWLHTWDTNVNNLSAKTGIDVLLNLGKGHSFVLTPQILWNLNKIDKIQFNKNNSQLGLILGYVYHFRNSNGTHFFNTYDIGVLNDEINNLRNQKPKEVIVERPARVIVKEVPTNPYIINFAYGSSILSTDAMRTLDRIPQGIEVDVVGTASPEGSYEFNLKLSEDRANAVAQYLRDRHVRVRNVKGVSYITDESQRTAIVYIN